MEIRMPGIGNDKSSKKRKIIIMVLASILALNAVQECCFQQSERRDADAGETENLGEKEYRIVKEEENFRRRKKK